MQIIAAHLDPGLLDLPWDLPLAEWPESVLAAMPRGLSRHVVRFVRVGGDVIAIKEIGDSVARREYEILRQLEKLDAPSVEPVGYITGRVDAAGEPLGGILMTVHMRYSLPYRTLFRRDLREDTAELLIDALAVLLVRLHLIGFYWGDVSLSNTLFLRDAEAYEAKLVDAETSEIHPEGLTRGQRDYDLEIARVNIIGELMDLAEAGDMAGKRTDLDELIAVGDRLVSRYHDLWGALTALEQVDNSERWRVANRVRALNDLGFDVEEMNLATMGNRLEITPRVVEAGHASKRLESLTGLVVHEKQARRLLADMKTYAIRHGIEDEEESFIAHEWLTNGFEATIRKVPIEVRYRLAPAQLFHEILDHRWFMSKELGHEVGIEEAVESYVRNVLEHKPDEVTVIEPPSTASRSL